MNISRRELATSLAAASVALPGASSQPQPSADPLTAAKDRIRANAESLSKEAIPMSTEPAFQFKA